VQDDYIYKGKEAQKNGMLKKIFYWRAGLGARRAGPGPVPGPSTPAAGAAEHANKKVNYAFCVDFHQNINYIFLRLPELTFCTYILRLNN
jgi:hypothetical protein